MYIPKKFKTTREISKSDCIDTLTTLDSSKRSQKKTHEVLSQSIHLSFVDDCLVIRHPNHKDTCYVDPLLTIIVVCVCM